MLDFFFWISFLFLPDFFSGNLKEIQNESRHNRLESEEMNSIMAGLEKSGLLIFRNLFLKRTLFRNPPIEILSPDCIISSESCYGKRKQV